MAEEEGRRSTELVARASLKDFILHEHTLLGLCFAVDGAPPIAVAGCCCICADDLSVRHRLCVFAFATLASIYVTLQVTTGVRSDVWAFMITLFVVMPCTCFFKSVIRRLSHGLDVAVPRVQSTLHVRLEELLLIGAGGGLVYWAYEREATHQLALAFYSLAAQMAAEIPSLIYKCVRAHVAPSRASSSLSHTLAARWCAFGVHSNVDAAERACSCALNCRRYFCCSICCPCCAPTTESMQLRDPLAPRMPRAEVPTVALDGAVGTIHAIAPVPAISAVPVSTETPSQLKHD